MRYNEITMRQWVDRKWAEKRGFTIVELLIVIAVIAILVTIVVVGYGAVVNNAHDSAVKNDLQKIDDAFKQFALDSDGVFPDTNIELRSLGIKLTADSYSRSTKNNIYLCENDTRTEYAVAAMSTSGERFVVKSESGIGDYAGNVLWNSTDNDLEATCQSIDPTYHSVSSIVGMADGQWVSWTGVEGAIASISCPTGYIVVPGNATFGTDDFCVMKYEAKNVSGVATSEAAGTPWASLTPATAAMKASAACSGCHLMTSGEWLTLAHNISKIGSNWTSGTVGVGTLYYGHSDQDPANSLAATTADNDGYVGTGNSTGAQRRTLTLSNGEVIWDLSGNLWEMIADTITTSNMPGPAVDEGYAIKDWNAIQLNGLSTIFKPATTNSAATSWTMTQIGGLTSRYGDPYFPASTVRPMYVGSSYLDNVPGTGIFALYLVALMSDSYPNVGFRVAI